MKPIEVGDHVYVVDLMFDNMGLQGPWGGEVVQCLEHGVIIRQYGSRVEELRPSFDVCRTRSDAYNRLEAKRRMAIQIFNGKSAALKRFDVNRELDRIHDSERMGIEADG